MASLTVEPPVTERLSLESISTVDLRLLSQSELTALSLCSSHSFDLRRCDDVVIPKIDRSVFNESAGSRKQTYSRLRLAPRKSDVITPGPTAKPRVSPLEPLDSERADNSRIVAIFKHLFNSPTSPFSDALVPVNVEYSDALPSGHSDFAVSIPVYGDTAEIFERKRKRGRKPKIDTMALAMVEYTEKKVEVIESEEILAMREKELANKNGLVVNLTELAKLEDPYGPEMRRRTEGREKPDELLGFVTDLKGKWGSQRKKRKIVDANEFGDALPNGWKVLVAIKKKQGRAWLFCRRYISPNGRYFLSCKEVSSYLLSLTGPQDLPQQNSFQCVQDSLVDNNATSENGMDVGMVSAESLSASQSNHLESQQSLPCNSQTLDHDKQLVLSQNVHPSGVQLGSSLKCHKCSTPFHEKNRLLEHLLSCHKRKRRKAGQPIEEDVVMKDGMYECQFCDKMFQERSSYFGHVGMHVKNYAKSIAGSPCATPQKNTCDQVPVGGFTVTVSGALGSEEANADSNAGTAITFANSEPNLSNDERKLKTGSDAESHLLHHNKGHNNLAACPQINTEAAQKDKTLNDEPSDKQDGILLTSYHKIGKVEDPVHVFRANSDFGAASENVLSNDECGNSGQVSASEHAATEMSCSPSVPIGDAETDSLPEGKQVGLGNNCNSGSVNGNAVNCDEVAPVNSPHADNEEKSLSNQKLKDRSLGNNIVDSSFFDVEVKGGSNGELIVGSGSINFDLDVDMEDDGQHTVSMNDISSGSHKEEETCDITHDKIGFPESLVADSKIESSEISFCTPDDRQVIDCQNMGEVLTSMINESEMDMGSFGRPEVKGDNVCSVAQAREVEDNGYGYIGNDSGKLPMESVLEPQGAGVTQVDQTCVQVNNTEEGSSRIDEELKGEQTTSSSDLFFTSRSSDTPLEPNVMTDNEHVHKVTANNVTTDSADPSTMQLHDKADNTRSNKSILDFGSITELNERFLNTSQHEIVHEGSSPFSLWGEPTCVEDDDRSSVYASARGVEQQDRSSENNSYNFVGLQQPCDEGYNLNKVSMNEQRYGIQVNETGLCNRNYNAAREGVPPENTHTLSGLQQQYNLNKSCQQNFGVQHGGSMAFISGDEARRERVTYGNSLSLASVQQSCETGYSLNKPCSQQTCESGYTLNKGGIGPIQDLSKLGVEHSQDMDLMIGFGNNSSRSNQGIETELLWRATEGNIVPGGLMDSSSSQAHASGFFQAFDFLSDKSGNGLCAGSEKFDNVSSFEGLRSTSVEPMEFSFLTSQDSNAQLEDPKVLSYNTEMDQGFGSSIWNEKGTPLPNMLGGPVMSTMCVWCGSEFHLDSLGCEMQSGSIGYLCPTCKARMSGQYL